MKTSSTVNYSMRASIVKSFKIASAGEPRGELPSQKNCSLMYRDVASY